MNATLIATTAGLATAFFWGTGDWLSAKSTKKLSPIEINFAIAAIEAVEVAVLIAISNIHIPNGGQIGRIVLGSTLITIAYLIFVKALSSGIVGVIVPLANSYALITVLLSALFLNQIFTTGQFASMVAIVIGAATLSYEKNHKKLPLRELHRETILAAIAAVTWGVAFFILNPVTQQINWQSLVVAAYIYSICLALALLIVAYRRETLTSIKRTLTYKPALLTAIIGSAGGITIYVGSDYSGSIVIPTVLSSGGPLVASIWAAIIDHEKIGYAKRVGAVFVVGGIILLNVLTS